MRLKQIYLIVFLLVINGCKPSVKYIERNKKSSESGATAQGSRPESGAPDEQDNRDNAIDEPIVAPEIIATNTSILTNSATKLQVTVKSNDRNLTYEWRTKSGPGQLIFSPSNALNPDVSAPVDGEYIAELTVTDSNENVDTKEFTFVWDTSPPSITMPSDLRISEPTKILGAIVTDADKNISVSWRLVHPAAGLTFSNNLELEPEIVAANVGSYILELSAADSLGQKSFGYMSVEKYTVAPGNAPQIKFGSNMVIRAPSKPVGVEVQSDSQPVRYLWSTTSGPGNLMFNSPTDLTPTISASTDGVYVATLTVTDNFQRSSSRSMVVVWDTTAPQISIDSPMSISRPTQPTVSVEDMSWKLRFKWSQTSGPGVFVFSNSDILNPFFSANVTGKYEIALVVTDSAGNSSSKSVIVNWKNPDLRAPEITLGEPLVAYAPKAPVGISVADEDPAVKIIWDQIIGPGRLSFNTKESVMPTISADTLGEYLARITATDSSGNRSEKFLRVSWISGDKDAPVIMLPALMTTKVPIAPQDVVVKDLSPFSVKWSQISGPGTLFFSDITLDSPLISATAAGAYVARLTATDSAGNSAFKDMTFLWEVMDQSSPVIRMGPQIRTSVAVKPVNVSVTDDDTQLTYSWSQIVGPGTLGFSNPNILHPLISASSPGDYVAALVVKDRQGNTSSGVLVVTWFIPDQTAPVLTIGPSVRIKVPTRLSKNKATDNDVNLTYLWQKISGPGHIVFNTPNQIDPVVSATSDGNYTARITVLDSAGNRAQGDFGFTWDKTPPVVFAGANRTADKPVVIGDSSVTDLSPFTVTWRVVSKPASSAIKISNVSILHPTISVDYPGVYTLELTAQDVLGQVSSSRVALNMNVGYWVPTNGVSCSQVCQSKGKISGRSPEGAQCTSGENVVASALPWVSFTQGCWPNCNVWYSNDAASVNKNCYRPTQKTDNDKTDLTMGCFCD
jgi:hypothetical protein